MNQGGTASEIVLMFLHKDDFYFEEMFGDAKKRNHFDRCST